MFPESMASIRASVSLLRMQSINWRWVRSPAESILRKEEDSLEGTEVVIQLRGRATLPSKIKTRSRSTSLKVSRIHLSSPAIALSMASGSFDLKRLEVIEADPRQRVERSETTVEIPAWLRASMTWVTIEEEAEVDRREEEELEATAEDDEVAEELSVAVDEPTETLDSLDRRWSTKPCSAKGAGSTPLLVNLSAKEAKHLKAPSETWLSSCLSNLDRESTQETREESKGSILPQSLETTDIAEWRVSLCTAYPLSRMKVRTALSPPASKTAPASRVQISSKTCRKESRWHWEERKIEQTFRGMSYRKRKIWRFKVSRLREEEVNEGWKFSSGMRRRQRQVMIITQDNAYLNTLFG